MKSAALQLPLEKTKILGQSILSRQTGSGQGTKKSLLFSINLTTLIDAFCILVIFLLSNMQGRLDQLQNDKDLVLPSVSISESGYSDIVVKVTPKGLHLNEKSVTIPELISELKSLNKKSLILQADKSLPYESLSEVIRAAGLSGYESYLFAVIPGNE